MKALIVIALALSGCASAALQTARTNYAHKWMREECVRLGGNEIVINVLWETGFSVYMCCTDFAVCTYLDDSLADQGVEI